jgi:hypothetical protein
LDVHDLERSGLDSLERGAVRVTAVGEDHPGSLQLVLPSGAPRVLPAHVLDEDQLAIGTENAVNLSERPVDVVDRAEDERRDDGVERRVLERLSLGRRLPDGDGKIGLRGAAAGAFEHARRGLGDDEFLDVARVMRQVESCTPADLEHAALHVRERLPPVLGEVLLHPPSEEVVERRADPVAYERHLG